MNNFSKIFSTLLTLITLGSSLLIFSLNAAPKKFWNEGNGKDAVVEGLDEGVHKLNQAFTVLAEKLSTSVVSIATRTKVQNSPRMNQQTEMFRFFFGNPFGDPRFQGQQKREAQSLGSGFVLNKEGYIITNSHVIRQGGRNADEVLAKFLGDSSSFEGWKAEIIGVDESTDVAVLKLKEIPKNIHPVVLGNSTKLKVGEWVMAIGNPYGHSHSVTSGIVSALGRNIDDLETRTDFIQTDASINPGNSGGPLFNLKGEVIGINTAIDSRAQGIGFAIPVDSAKNVVSQLIEKGQVDLGWIGVYLAELNPGIAEQLGLKNSKGVLIQEVIEGEPAEKAGLRSYDVIVGVDNSPVDTGRDLLKKISNMSIGAKATLDVVRDRKPIQLQIQIGKRKSENELAKQESKAIIEKAKQGKGMVLGELNSQQKSQLGLIEGQNGLIVQGVAPNSFASEAGVLPGDILLEVNRKPVQNIAQTLQMLNVKKKAFLLKLQRQNSTVIILMES